MSIKEILQGLGEKTRARKELIREVGNRLNAQRIVEDRLKSADERELERLQKEDRDKQVKEELEYMRKKRDFDINHNHQILDTPNVTKDAQWHILKEKNQFANNRNIFMNNKNLFVKH